MSVLGLIALKVARDTPILATKKENKYIENMLASFFLANLCFRD